MSKIPHLESDEKLDSFETISINNINFPHPPRHTDQLSKALRKAESENDFEKIERDLILSDEWFDQKRLNRMKAQWACITAKSQRRKKFAGSGDRIYYQIEQYEDLVVAPKYERTMGTAPPSRENEKITRFTERSRQRMMSKGRRLKKSGLPLPYFVTLTYHKNYTDCQRAKEHLNTFLQRWRRRGGDFAYFWKLEAQKRGAIHFHLGMFLPTTWRKIDIQKIRETIQTDWAQVTKDVDGIDAPYTQFDYIRKKKYKDEQYDGRTVTTRCAKPQKKNKRVADWDHQQYGTNVRTVKNWTQFLAYLYKYLGKEQDIDPFIDAETGEIQPTGRFWGFSYNLDFSALQIGILDERELERVNEFCNNLNDTAYRQYLEHMRQNKKRVFEKFGPDQQKQIKQELYKISKSVAAQKRRYQINKQKIRAGYMLQFEINKKYSSGELGKLDPLQPEDYLCFN